ncbi:MAG: FkbM family methyltransferase [Opitutaceae bacterium]|nr:FkbM family methyltransferase [Opitutaceae bacterium]
MASIQTHVPGRPPIELVAYYDSFAWYYPNCEPQTKRWFVQQARPDWVYLDCGANIGYYSILFAQLSPHGHIHAVEPTATADMLRTNLAHHRLGNVTVHQQAVGRYAGRRTEKIFRLWGGPPEEMEYDFETIDTLVARLAPTRLDCIKIDVDSFDFEVLMGAEQTLAKYDPWLVVELNHALGVRGYSNLAAAEWLLDHGYRHCQILDHDNFVARRSAPPESFATGKAMTLHFAPPHEPA